MKHLDNFRNLCLTSTLHLMFVVVTMGKDQLLTFHPFDVDMCQDNCTTYSFCKSFVYKGKTLTCDLSCQVRKPHMTNGFTVFHVDCQVPNGSCSSEAVYPAMRCLKTRSWKYIWIQENVAGLPVDDELQNKNRNPFITFGMDDSSLDDDGLQNKNRNPWLLFGDGPPADVNSTRSDNVTAKMNGSVTVKAKGSVTEVIRDSTTANPNDSVTAKPSDSVTVKGKDNVTVKGKDSGTVKPNDSVTAKAKQVVTTKSNDSVTTKPNDSVTVKGHKRVTVKPKDSVTVKPKESVTAKRKDSLKAKRKDSVKAKRKGNRTKKRKGSVKAKRKRNRTAKRKGSVTAKKSFTKEEGSDDNCQRGKFQCGTESFPHCGHSWKWSGSTGKCIKSTWDITDEDINQPQNGNDEGFRVSITATYIGNYGRQSIDLDFINQPCLHFGVDMRSGYSAVALRTFYDYGPPETNILTQGRFFFRTNQEYTVDIVEQNGLYKVFINGRMYLQPRYSFPRSGPLWLRVDSMYKNLIPWEVTIRKRAQKPIFH